MIRATLLLMILLAGAAPLPAQDFEELLTCEICSDVLKNMDLLTACNYTLHDWSRGTLHVFELKEPKLMQKFRDFEKHDRVLCEKYIGKSAAECSGRLCGNCSEYLAFRRRGLVEERIETPTGSIVITRTGDRALLDEVHDWAGRMRKMMASVDPSAFRAQLTESEGCCEECGKGEEEACTAKICDPDSSESVKIKAASPADAAESALGKLPPAVLAELLKCELCSLVVSQPELMLVSRPEIIFMKTGVAFSDRVADRKHLEKYQAFQKKFHGRIDEIMKNGGWDTVKGKVCPFCWKFAELEKAGAIFDWSLTSDGAITVVFSADPLLVGKIHELAKEITTCNEMFRSKL